MRLIVLIKAYFALSETQSDGKSMKYAFEVSQITSKYKCVFVTFCHFTSYLWEKGQVGGDLRVHREIMKVFDWKITAFLVKRICHCTYELFVCFHSGTGSCGALHYSTITGRGPAGRKWSYFGCLGYSGKHNSLRESLKKHSCLVSSLQSPS